MGTLDLGLWRYDVATASLEWDTSVYARYGVTREEFPTPQQFWMECLTEDSITRARAEMQLALEGKKDYHAVFELRLPRGESRYVLARAKVFRDGKGRATHLYGINMDVTEQTRIEVENQRLLAQLREAQAIAQTGSWTFDLTDRKVTWSSELYRILEISEPQPANKLYELYRSRMRFEDQEHFDKMMAQAIETGQGYDYRRTLHFGDGRVKHIEGICRVVRDENGKSVRLSGTCRDLTREMELQQKLEAERAKSERNARLASLGELSAGVAHEINNPLAIIDGNARLLAVNAHDGITFSSKIQSILNACSRISRIVGGLQKFAGKSGKKSVRSHSLRGLVADTLELVEAKARLARAVIKVNIATDERILCDKVQIEQVLINLLNNAIDAVKDAPEKRIRISADAQRAQAVLRVWNSGAGIPKEVQEKLFTPFFTTKPIGEGTGLGLSISRGIVEDHGGSIALLEDTPGTCFEVRLPLDPAPARPPPPPRADASRPAPHA